MISDRAFADICAGSYDPTYPFDARYTVGDVYTIVKRVENLDVVCFRGSVSIDDWIRDFAAVPFTFPHLDLGIVHAGFLLGMAQTVTAIVQALRSDVPLAVTGHSLGAARAWLFVGLMLKIKVPVRVVTFGSPKPGFPHLAKLIADAGISATSYRNAPPSGHDRVTDLPFTFMPELPWTAPGAPLVDIAVEPDTGDTGDFRYHHIQHYQQGAATAG